MEDSDRPILEAGRNCWKVARAERVAVLVDAAAYFAAFYDAARKAERSIHIAGWEFHSQVELVRGRDRAQSDLPSRLGPFLDALATRKPQLDIRLLVWDFSMLFSLEREPLPVYNLGWRFNRRIKVRMDGEHPIGGCHHQKIVVIDGKVAFAGGLDLRVDPDGEAYPPFHDLQLLLDGQAAGVLAELFRDRWLLAEGESFPAPHATAGDPWPEAVAPDFRNAPVGLARTEPGYKKQPAVREVEALYLDGIRSARHCIYVENQYFTASVVKKALAARLAEEHGPEIVLVLPRRSRGWLAHAIMDAMRAKVLGELHAADAHGRLRLCYPHIEGLGEENVMVHAKVMIVDDRLLRVGSSNLCNRSMGLDTECDLALDAAGSPELAQGIRRVRARLLAEHLGVEPEAVERRTQATGSLLAVVDGLGGASRSLRPLELDEGNTSEVISESQLLDPECPVHADRILDAFLEEESGKARDFFMGWKGVLLLVMGVAALVALWHATPLDKFLSKTFLAGEVSQLVGTSWLYVVIVAAFLVGGTLAVPVTALIAATALVLPPVPGFVTALAGSLLSAALTYALGSLLGRDTVRRLGGKRLNRASRWLGRKGLASMFFLRLFPVAPFLFINLVAGASHIRFRDFLLGTLLGMAPGIAALTLFTDRLLEVVRHPGLVNLLILAGIYLCFAVAANLLHRRLSRTRP